MLPLIAVFSMIAAGTCLCIVFNANNNFTMIISIISSWLFFILFIGIIFHINKVQKDFENECVYQGGYVQYYEGFCIKDGKVIKINGKIRQDYK